MIVYVSLVKIVNLVATHKLVIAQNQNQILKLMFQKLIYHSLVKIVQSVIKKFELEYRETNTNKFLCNKYKDRQQDDQIIEINRARSELINLDVELLIKNETVYTKVMIDARANKCIIDDSLVQKKIGIN